MILDRLQKAAREWKKENGPLLVGREFVRCLLWGQSGNAGPEVNAFIDSSRVALGTAGYEDLLSEKDTCGVCALEFRLENLSLCTECEAVRCPTCRYHDCANGGTLVG